MKEVNKRLVEVEYILKKLENQYLEKIPQKIWNYLDKNKDKNYIYKYDDTKMLKENNLNIDTIAILTYINIKYLLDENQKNELNALIIKDRIIEDEEKRKLYNTDDIFKNVKKENNEKNSLVEVKIEKWYQKLFSFFYNMFK